MPLIDLTGQKFGELTVLERAGSTRYSGNARWLCRCKCGSVIKVGSGELRSGHSKSCGCSRPNRGCRGGHSDDPLGYINHRIYRIFSGMHKRCSNSNEQAYKNYGGRGISVCAEWQAFKPFMEWSLANGYTEALTLDRIDNDGNYEPSNCRWATIKEQANNRRTNTHIEVDGATHTIAEWSEKTGICASTIRNRLDRGWSGHDSVSRQVMSNQC